ncbi:hypothetical protein GCM10009827_001030 [Dactylosporangium maewongense]|uniref:Uncharacterized protein n=1 Tax=Dactylosporangium maewongense TaxID=634393 RepID=A0ABN1ZHM8_9ACTN
MGALKPWHVLVLCGLCTAVVVTVVVVVVVTMVAKRRSGR